MIIHDMSNEDYHADTTHISASGLKLFARSPAHYWAAYLDPKREKRQPTAAMKLGTATHCAILEPRAFNSRYICIPEGIDRRTTAGKAEYAALLDTGKELLSPDDYDRIAEMSISFLESEQGGDLFSIDHRVESSIFAEIDGIKCKCRPDYMTDDYSMVMDVKTTKDASPEEFGKQAWNLGYHLQAAFYRRVIAAETGVTPRFLFGCVESEAPHLTAFYGAPDYLLDYADEVVDGLLEQYAECLKTGKWPGYDNGVKELIVPGYAQRIIENNGIESWEITNV